ncbi:guanylate kinase [Chroogloeocystis siderophila]|uniref:Guanylate kinase n=1 Tax=Chroogloeocystis siderophila 5.2 s.c.1 TaxID=247279 RepID=A0A1U7HVX9_9CHRO|nr:guanylate kinase [Chroogloeocystis siderophila]OKH27750.1 guanylate kinase [Chroogloeocystis siderophila 5.2 s.c.1]
MTPVLSLQGSATPPNCLPEGKLIVLTGPSGVGKGTLVRALLERHPELYFSVSVTTRAPRPGEIHGKQYYFVSRSEFQQMIEQNKLLEWAEFAGNYYGTPRDTVLEQISKGKCVLLEIELEGARQICQSYPEAKRIFIMPPSLAELEHRLRGRGQDSPDAIARRLQRAKDEISAADEFDIQIVNDDFETALDAITSTVFSFCGNASK